MATYHLDSLGELWVVRDDSGASVLEAQTLAAMMALMHDRAKREGANLIVHDVLAGEDVTFSFADGDGRAALRKSN